MNFLKYSSGLTHDSFWFLESKKIAELILEDYSKEDIIELALKDNLFQVETENRTKRIVSVVYKRLTFFSEEILEYFLRVDVNSAKVFVLISILAQDRLFFEFMYEVFREHIILGNFTLKNRDFDIFFDNKALQSDIVSEWSENNVDRLKRGYRIILNEAGVLDTSKEINEILVPFIDLKFQDILKENNLGPYVYSITGEQ